MNRNSERQLDQYLDDLNFCAFLSGQIKASADKSMLTQFNPVEISDLVQHNVIKLLRICGIKVKYMVPDFFKKEVNQDSFKKELAKINFTIAKSNCHIQIGEVKNDKNHIMSHGWGLQFDFDNSSIHIGEFKEGMRHGRSKVYKYNGVNISSVFIGQQDKDLKKGPGLLKFFDNNYNFILGYQQNDKLNGFTICNNNLDQHFEGQYEDQKQSGQAFQYQNQTHNGDVKLNNAKEAHWTKEVYMKNNKRNGQCICKHQNGTQFKGTCKDNSKHGVGFYYDVENDTFYEGEFALNKMEGFGTLIRMKDGFTLIGKFKRDQMISGDQYYQTSKSMIQIQKFVKTCCEKNIQMINGKLKLQDVMNNLFSKNFTDNKINTLNQIKNDQEETISENIQQDIKVISNRFTSITSKFDQKFDVCMLCKNKSVEVALSCGHSIYCQNCALSIIKLENKCGFCGQEIKGLELLKISVKTFF